MTKRAIIFDLDGTLWDSSEQVVPAWNIALARHAELGKQITTKEMNSFFGKNIDEIAALLLPDVEKAKRLSIVEECCDEEQVYLRANGGTLYPNLRETLAALKKNYHLYIVSNCQEGYLNAFLDYHDMREFFDDVEMSGRTKKSKGENIRMVFDRNALDEAMYIGDTMGDLNAAGQAGIEFVYAEYGFGDVGECKYSISSIDKLPEVADRACRPQC
ncbi:MAG: HAD family hydrolase [Butyrivibrio sp.]|nr:HAD family hydrolase [Butyrivibrio sp.]